MCRLAVQEEGSDQHDILSLETTYVLLFWVRTFDGLPFAVVDVLSTVDTLATQRTITQQREREREKTSHTVAPERVYVEPGPEAGPHPVPYLLVPVPNPQSSVLQCTVDIDLVRK
jgi:hypothetical protein